MRIIFMGTPDFAVESLKALMQTHHEVCAVVTVPDKMQGRGLKIKSSPVKQFAEKNNIAVLQPDNLKSTEFSEQLRQYSADCFVVVAFKILPKEIFTIPPIGTVNVHGSLLPAYRGAAPINWAIINGEKKSGVTTMLINANVDTGDILLQDEAAITDDMTAGMLHDILAEKGAKLLVKTLELLEKKEISPRHQDNSKASKAPKLKPEITQIDFNKPAKDVHNFIRGLSPYPAAYTYWKSKKIKIFRTKIDDPEYKGEPGEILHIKKDSFNICCNPGTLTVYKLQLEGKKQMKAADFLNGYSLKTSEKLPS